MWEKERWRRGTSWDAGDNNVPGTLTFHQRNLPCPRPGLHGRRQPRRGKTPPPPLTFTFMRSSQKFRGGSTMVVLSSMT